jgi:hypothetical protein
MQVGPDLLQKRGPKKNVKNQSEAQPEHPKQVDSMSNASKRTKQLEFKTAQSTMPSTARKDDNDKHQTLRDKKCHNIPAKRHSFRVTFRLKPFSLSMFFSTNLLVLPG